jgi:NADH-quinone oxidoreductase subunit C
MATKQLSGEQIAAWAEALVPGSVAKQDGFICYLKPGQLRETMAALRTSPDADFAYLVNLCGVDYWDHLEVVYHVHSLVKNQIGTIKVEVPDRDKPSVQSVTPVWYGAWMQECEAYDMFGIQFEGHPDLKRILLWDGFPGWPLRKDFLSMPGGLQPGLNEFAGVAPKPEPPVRVIE